MDSQGTTNSGPGQLIQEPDHNPVYIQPMSPGAPLPPGLYPAPTSPGAPVPPGFYPAPMSPGAPLPPGLYPAPMTPGVPLPPAIVPFQDPGLVPAPLRPLDCPLGLEYLTQIDQLLVQQIVSLAEVLLNWEVNNHYIVKNSVGQQVFTVAEENNCCTLQVCGPNRPFTLHTQDNLGQEVLTLTRPLNCDLCCFPCCLQELEVQSPPGNPIGYVLQNWHPYLPKFTVQNDRREPQLKIEGPCVACQCCSDVNFDVKSLDGTVVVGRISKQWGGVLHEAFTDADHFGISFPMDLDVKMKAVMLGACFLIDFMYFETSKGRTSHS